MGKTRVLIVDDSAVIRRVLTDLLSRDPDIEIVGTASDPLIARDQIEALSPDVLTLDVEMPRMDGLTFLEQLMGARPMPVVMVSSLTEAGCETTLRALELAAVDFFTKPQIDQRGTLEEHAWILIEKVKAAAKARVRPATGRPAGVVKRRATSAIFETTDTIIAMGASTGGTEALREILQGMPPDAPPIIVTQHMPADFTKAFANRLNAVCQITVKEAEHGDSVIRGQALIAPGGHHMVLVRSGACYHVAINQDPLVNRHRPSVDVMFHSAAQYAGANCIGVILTGMGADGAIGMAAMKKSGAYNIAQDEASCVVFGMPNEAIKAGGVDTILPLSAISNALLARVGAAA